MTSHRLSITLLGEFSITIDDKVYAFSGDRPISLLTYLVLHRDTAVSRQQLAFTLWPDSSDSQARTNLRNLLHTLRQTVPQVDDILATDSTTLRWQSDPAQHIDVAEFEKKLATAADAISSEEKIACFESAVALYKGDLLPGNYDDWIMPLREELRQQYLDALQQLVSLLEQQKAYRAAARYGQRHLMHDPLDEQAYVQLMRLYALGGDRAGLRRVYSACVATLRQELDVEPSTATQAAYEQLMRLEAPGSTLPESSSIETAPANPRPLPQPATQFVGREAELGHIAELLANPGCRLLTIVGPGGMGKTRLALESAIGHQRIFADGAVWVPLMPVQTTEQVATAVADALRYRLSGTTPATSELSNVLKNKELLLVFDNFEHVIEATSFLSDILEKTTSVKLLVTSQQTLAMQAEWRFELGAMPMPTEQTLTAWSSSSAIQLFEQSARRVSGNFAMNNETYRHVARICQLVGGIPLGIELAASWTRLLSCEEIAAEIENSLDFLTVHLKDVPARHRSLRAVFDYSWGMLTPLEQQALACLSLFRGGFTREAAEQVAGASLSLLSSLTDRSLVQRIGVGRFGLHSLVRQYAHDALRAEASWHQKAGQQHMEYYLPWIADKREALCSERQKEAVHEMTLELANIRIAWQQAIVQQRSDLLQNATFSLYYFYELRGFIYEGKQALQAAVDALALTVGEEDRETWLAIAELRAYLTNFLLRLGEITEAIGLLEPLVIRLEKLNDETNLHIVLRYLGGAYASHGQYEESLSVLHRSLAVAKQLNKPWEAALTHAYIGMVMHDKGELHEADSYVETAVEQSQKLGDTRLIAYCLMLAGRANLLKATQLDEACHYLEQSLAIGEDTNDPYVVNTSLTILGLVKRAQGDAQTARSLLEKALALFKVAEDWVGVERISVNLGLLERDVGNIAAAKGLFAMILRAKQREHVPRYMLLSIICLAEIKQHEGDCETALAWIMLVLAHPRLDRVTQRHAERVRVELESMLDAAAVTKAHEEAARLSVAAIVAEIEHA